MVCFTDPVVFACDGVVADGVAVDGIGVGNNKHQTCQDCLNTWIESLDDTILKNPERLNCFIGKSCTSQMHLESFFHLLNDKLKLKLFERALYQQRRKELQTSDRDALALQPKPLVMTLEDHLRTIEEQLNKQCPHCHTVFFEFDGCMAVQCGNCHGLFCGGCFAACQSSDEAHIHARRVHGDFWAHPINITLLNQRYFRSKFWKYLDINITMRNLILSNLPKHFYDALGPMFDLAKNSVAPNYGITLVQQQPVAGFAQMVDRPVRIIGGDGNGHVNAINVNFNQAHQPPPQPRLRGLQRRRVAVAQGPSVELLARVNRFQGEVFDLYRELFRKLQMPEYDYQQSEMECIELLRVLDSIQKIYEYLYELLEQEVNHNYLEALPTRIKMIITSQVPVPRTNQRLKQYFAQTPNFETVVINKFRQEIEAQR